MHFSPGFQFAGVARPFSALSWSASTTRMISSMFRPVVKNLLQRVFGGSSVHFVASLFESKPPTSEEIEDLQKLLDDLRSKRAKRGSR